MSIVFHGSCMGGLTAICANSPSHMKKADVAYFTNSYVYALICCRLPEENFVTAGMREGKLHYYERFPNQLKVIYAGKRGYIYKADTDKTPLEETRPYSFESMTDVPVDGCDYIEDVYEAISAEIKKGSLIVHRFEEIDPAEQKMMRDHILAQKKEWKPAMVPFYEKHFGDLSFANSACGTIRAFEETKQ